MLALHCIKSTSNSITTYTPTVRLSQDKLKLKLSTSTLIDDAEAEISRLLVPSMSQARKTLDPVIPIMQLNSIFH